MYIYVIIYQVMYLQTRIGGIGFGEGSLGAHVTTASEQSRLGTSWVKEFTGVYHDGSRCGHEVIFIGKTDWW